MPQHAWGDGLTDPARRTILRTIHARGFALALGKMALTSDAGEVVNITRLNVRTIAV